MLNKFKQNVLLLTFKTTVFFKSFGISEVVDNLIFFDKILNFEPIFCIWFFESFLSNKLFRKLICYLLLGEIYFLCLFSRQSTNIFSYSNAIIWINFNIILIGSDYKELYLIGFTSSEVVIFNVFDPAKLDILLTDSFLSLLYFSVSL